MGSLCSLPEKSSVETETLVQSAAENSVEPVAVEAAKKDHTGPRFLQTQQTVILKHPSHPHKAWHKFGLVVREWLPTGAVPGCKPLFPGGPPRDPLFPFAVNGGVAATGQRANALLVVATAYTGDPDQKFQFGPSPEAGKPLVSEYNRGKVAKKDIAGCIMEGDLIVNVNNCIFKRRNADAVEYPEELLKSCGKTWLSDLMVLELQGAPEERGAELVWELTLERGDEKMSAVQRTAELLKQCTPEQHVKAVKL